MLGLVARSTRMPRDRGAVEAPLRVRRQRPARRRPNFTGYWVSIVTGHLASADAGSAQRDYSMLPLTPEARKIADSWDLAKAKAETDPVQGYGPPALMRVPGRLHIHWTDDNTLQLDTDSGTQMRSFRFGSAASSSGQAPSLQGHSMASWEFLGRARPRRRPPKGRVNCACGRPR